MRARPACPVRRAARRSSRPTVESSRAPTATYASRRCDRASAPPSVGETAALLAKGSARFRHEGCGLDRVVALSCKGRGFCPRCAGRRMTETARHLAERVVPEVRTRQWVLSFPFQLRWALAFHHELVKALGQITYAEVARRSLRLARDGGLQAPRGGAFFVIQRFGSDLRLNVHLHALFLDGAFG